MRALAIDPQTPTILYAGTDGGVFKSTDSGATWTATTTSMTSRTVAAPLDWPGLAVGHTWLRNDGPYTLTAIDHTRYVFVAPGDREVRLTRHLGVVSVRSGGYQTAFNPPIEVPWPLQVGRWGQIFTTWQVPMDARQLPVTCIWAVEAAEDLKLPGGEVKTVRVVFEWEPTATDTITRSSFPKKRLTLWYVPDLQQLVKGEYSGPGR